MENMAISFRFSASLIFILGLLYALALLLKHFRLPGQHRYIHEMEIHSSVSVGQKERVVIVSVPDKRLVLGVTPGGITLLDKLPLLPVAEPAPTSHVKKLLSRKQAQANPSPVEK